MKQGLLREGQKPGLGMSGSGRIEILRCVKGLRKGMAEWYIKFIDLKLQNKHQSNLIVYITKRRSGLQKQRYIEEHDFKLLLDVGVGGCAKGPDVKGTFVQPVFNVPLERDITGCFIVKPKADKPISGDTQIHVWCPLQNKSDRDPAEWYPILHEHRKNLEDMFFERAASSKKNSSNAALGSTSSTTASKLRFLKQNAQKAFDRFDADGSGTVDVGEYSKMLRYLELFLLPCDSKQIFNNCDMDDTGELDQDQFEVALYVIMTIQDHQSRAASEAAATAAANGSGSREGGDGDDDDGSQHPTMRLAPHEAFESFDNDKDGLIDQLEFNEALRCLGVVKSSPKDPLSQEADLRRLMDKVLEQNGKEDNGDDEDPTRLINFVQFLNGWVDCCNVPYEIKCRNVVVAKDKGKGGAVPMKPKDALLQHVASAAQRQYALMAHARSQGWEMKRLARIDVEKKRRATEKQAEQENSKARKDLALTEKSDRIALKAARMNKFQAERKLLEYKRESKKAQKLRLLEELDEKKNVMANRIKEKELLASRMGWDCIDMSDQRLVELPASMYWWRQAKKNKDEESKDLSSVLLMDLSRNRLEELPSNEFFFRADKIQVLTLDYNSFSMLPSGLKDCRDLVNLTLSQNILEGPTVLGCDTPLNALQDLILLDLSGNCISKWPRTQGLHGLTSLEVLLLGNNQLTEIPGPECVATLIALKKIDFSNNQIHTLGSDFGIGMLTCLQLLNVSGNVLESLPDDLGCIGGTLLTLNVSNNNLRWLPSTLNQLVGLRYLNFSKNQLTTIPANMKGLQNLVEINGSRNVLGMIPESFGTLLNLEIISFQHNNLRNLPETIGLLTRLQHVDLQNNQLKDLPREMGSWTLLEKINVTSNEIISLPKSCGHCHRLKTLQLGYNCIDTIPHTVSTLTNLEIFNLHNNRLTSLSSGIGKATNLLLLDLGGNVNLKSLPRSIGNLEKLKSLDLSSCGISKLPNDLVKCTALQSLWLRHNRLEALPIELVEQIPTLAVFDVMGNPLRKLPEKWSGLKRKNVSGTGYTSRDAR